MRNNLNVGVDIYENYIDNKISWGFSWPCEKHFTCLQRVDFTTAELNTTWGNSQAVEVLLALCESESAMWISLHESHHLHTLQHNARRDDALIIYNTTFTTVLFTQAPPK